MGDLRYRPMTAADLPAATALWAQAEGVELAEGDRPEQLAAYLKRNRGLSFVAEPVAATALAGAVLAGHDGRRGLLYHLAVAPDQRRRGIGRALVERAVAALRADGVERVLILVARDNDAGRDFWARHGWETLASAEPMGRNL